MSDHAVAALLALDLRRDPDWTTTDDVLEAILRARGASASPAALEVERLIGGVALAPGRHVGVFAAIRARERRPALVERREAFLTGAEPRLRPSAFARAEGALLLPLSSGEDPAWSVDPCGRVHFEHHDDDYGYTSLAFDSALQLVEALALLEHPFLPPEAPRQPQHVIALDALDGEAIAAALGLAPWPPASGVAQVAWRTDDRWVLERRVPGFAEDTLVGARDLDAARAAVAVALSRCRDVVWRSPVRGALPPALARVDAPRRSQAQGGGERHTWGAPRAYGFELARAHATRTR